MRWAGLSSDLVREDSSADPVTSALPACREIISRGRLRANSLLVVCSPLDWPYLGTCFPLTEALSQNTLLISTPINKLAWNDASIKIFRGLASQRFDPSQGALRRARPPVEAQLGACLGKRTRVGAPQSGRHSRAQWPPLRRRPPLPDQAAAAPVPRPWPSFLSRSSPLPCSAPGASQVDLGAWSLHAGWPLPWRQPAAGWERLTGKVPRRPAPQPEPCPPPLQKHLCSKPTGGKKGVNNVNRF